jgi:ribosomal protein S18 acetylase RimI-like enzyme
MEATTIGQQGFFDLFSTYETIQIPESHQQVEYLENEAILQTADTTTSIFCKLETKHAKQVARLHIKGISRGFISSLGIDFVTALYEGIIQNGTSYGFITEDGKVLGFVAFTKNLGKIYKSIVLKKGLRFAFILAGRMLSLRRIKKVFETFFYPGRIKKMGLPSAELLSIVVSPAARQMGLATQLVLKGFRECQNNKTDEVKVLVAADNKAANTLYQKCGFEFAAQIDSHGVLSNIYVARTGQYDRFLAMQESFQPTINQAKKPRLITAVA